LFVTMQATRRRCPGRSYSNSLIARLWPSKGTSAGLGRRPSADPCATPGRVFPAQSPGLALPLPGRHKGSHVASHCFSTTWKRIAPSHSGACHAWHTKQNARLIAEAGAVSIEFRAQIRVDFQICTPQDNLWGYFWKIPLFFNDRSYQVSGKKNHLWARNPHLWVRAQLF
jgi:hypothetical protein